MVRTRLPGIKEADKIRPRVFTSMITLMRRAWQSGRMTSELSKRDAPDITAPLQLGHIFGHGIIEAELATLHGFRE
jgi:hypothetical protein